MPVRCRPLVLQAPLGSVVPERSSQISEKNKHGEGGEDMMKYQTCTEAPNNITVGDTVMDVATDSAVNGSVDASSTNPDQHVCVCLCGLCIFFINILHASDMIQRKRRQSLMSSSLRLSCSSPSSSTISILALGAESMMGFCCF